MIIKSNSLKNLKSFGNKKQNDSLNTTTGDLILLSGQNGAGKCLSPDTEVDIQIDDEKTKEKLLNFLKNRNLPF